jgi:glycosyltransferase involved in cell wall biosynthesis
MKISVIVPIYNGEKYLDRCLKSISIQTYTDFEVVLVNDGSTDGSREICENWTKQDERFCLYNNENHGVSYSRNFGIDKAIGEYILFIDCDDFIEKDTLQILQGATNQKYDLVIANYYQYHSQKEIGKNVEIPTREYSKKEFLNSFWNLYFSYIINQPWAKIYKTSIIKNEGIRFPIEYELGEDLIFNLQYIEKSSHFYTYNQYVYFYRETDGSLTSKYRENYLEIQLQINECIKQLLIRNDCYDQESQEQLNKNVCNILISSIQNLFLPTCKLSHKEVKKKLKEYLSRQEVEKIKQVQYSEKRLQIFKKMIEKKKVKTIILYSRLKEWIRKIWKKKSLLSYQYTK